MFVGEFRQLCEPLVRVYAAGPPDFGEAFGAEVERPAVAFRHVVGSRHPADVGDAMRQAQRVTGLVDDDTGSYRERPETFADRHLGGPSVIWWQV
jgi:hypothetical protein